MIATRPSAREVIERIYRTGVVTGRSGRVHALNSAIDRAEGEILSDVIRRDAAVLRTLEIGCAYGLSSLFICDALAGRPGALHTIVDPLQSSQWDGGGVRHLAEAGCDRFELIEQPSELALPRLLEAGANRFDFVFVDGWHTFDHTLLDCFYATKLLRVGGYLAVDDVGYPSVHRAVDYVRTYPCYAVERVVTSEPVRSLRRTIARALLAPLPRRALARTLSRALYRRLFDDAPVTLVVLRKIADDTRPWDWFDDAF